MMSESTDNSGSKNPISGLIASFNSKADDETTTLGKAKSMVLNQYNQVVPLKEFLRKPSPPTTMGEATKRIIHNTSKFRANYIILSVVLFAYALLSSPLLLLSLIMIYAGYIFAESREEQGNLVILGKSYAARDLKLGVMIAAVPLLYISGATSALFWLIGASLFISLTHAALTSIPNADNLEEKAQDRPAALL